MQASNDVSAVAALLQRTPYHADALLTMFDLHRSMGEHAQVQSKLSERSLFKRTASMSEQAQLRPESGSALVACSVSEQPQKANVSAQFRDALMEF